MDWTQEQTEQLKKLWDQELSAADISKIMSIQKSLIMKKINDLELEQSPKTGKNINVLDMKSNMCCWPIGDPSESDFRFCMEKTLPGKSYCAYHYEMAYMKSKNSR